jgi:carbamoyl-phosphate synthase large subunit
MSVPPVPPAQVVGLINIQMAVQDEIPYIIEANPRASRTVPFVAKAVGHPIAKYASLVMAGRTLKEVRSIGAIIIPVC